MIANFRHLDYSDTLTIDCSSNTCERARIRKCTHQISHHSFYNHNCFKSLNHIGLRIHSASKLPADNFSDEVLFLLCNDTNSTQKKHKNFLSKPQLQLNNTFLFGLYRGFRLWKCFLHTMTISCCFFSLSQTLFLSRRVCVGERDFLLSFKLVDDFVISACFHTHINTGNFIVFNFKFLFFECFVSNFAAFVAGYDTACVYHKTNRIQSKREFNSSLDETIKT